MNQTNCKILLSVLSISATPKVYKVSSSKNIIINLPNILVFIEVSKYALIPALATNQSIFSQ